METMRTNDYYTYKSAIEAANSAGDKDALRSIQMQLVSKYGLDNDDVRYLLKLFRYTV